MLKWFYSYILLIGIFLQACSSDDNTPPIENFTLEEITINGKTNQEAFSNIDPQNLSVELKFSTAVDKSTVDGNIILKDKGNQQIKLSYTYGDNKTVTLKPVANLSSYSKYTLSIWPGLKSTAGVTLSTGKNYDISTTIDMTDKFPRIPDEDLLDLVQSQTFKYFWEFGHPVSGMARERTTSGDVVTTGGTGFGVMAMIVAAERGFVSKNDALSRIQKIVTFLDTKCTSYHGVFSHWVNGATGATQPFSQYDDGADLVETALLFQGLLTARQYFKANTTAETKLREDITRLWEAIEWTWFQRDGQNALYWHWSPNYGWQMNMKVSGWNEALIVYALAASSPTHPITAGVYKQGWTRNGAFTNGKSFYGYQLLLGEDNGGPLFFSHYSFLGINPKDMKDQYANYWTQNTNHTLINYNYCIANPKGYGGYSADCWGLTASDGDKGYSAHSPTNDRGVIAPTAALSSMPYTPEESMKALHFFYYKLGDKLWSDYGFIDAFNLSEQWYDNQQIAIDQGPIVVMIENYRTGLLWSLFMADQEIKDGLRKLGFQSPEL
ncbi:glucoamylase family protein [Prevotella sp. 10(H)]|uniref:glucoamylase family protein n=1 Tax=Prevotella sp. 10(H) TaxID=1158294 RepID=UPI0004A73958|nr:glucoamylase family protein [Prevotella sp. 10(H)]